MTERRNYGRIKAAVTCRPVVAPPHAHDAATVDLSLTGVRIYSDETYPLGTILKMEFVTGVAVPVTFTARVVWVEGLPPAGPAKHDIGMEFVDLTPKMLQLLAALLEDAGADR
jgi:PilZ domain